MKPDLFRLAKIVQTSDNSAAPCYVMTSREEIKSICKDVSMKLSLLALVALPLLIAACGTAKESATLESTGPTQERLPEPTAWPAAIFDQGIPMALVPAGPFEMGSDVSVALAECQKLRPDGDCQSALFEDERPIHTVTLQDFYIDQYEVTNARFAACVDSGVCEPPSSKASFSRSSYYGNPEYADYPVVYVSWQAAKTYCEWRGARLPTEAEWEKAARGIERRLYPWGDIFDGRRVNFCDSNCEFDWRNSNYDDGYADTARVGAYLAGVGPYGAYDMAGNVWEWVSDWYAPDYYASSPDARPGGPASGQGRGVRGGAWLGNGSAMRSAERDWAEPTKSFDTIGFRCVRSP